MNLVIPVGAVLAILVIGASALSGSNVCSRTESSVRRVRYCHFWFLWCWGWRYTRRWSYSSIDYCCSGYKSSGSRCIAHCPGGCGGGTCVGPSRCDCGSTYTGMNCGTPQCSYQFPCYPGICSYPSNCQCAQSFGKPRSSSKHCTEITQKPLVMTANASLEFYDVDRKDIIYSLTLFADDTNTMEGWSNIKKFNRIDLAMEAFLDLGDLPQRPSYVTSDRFGIESANIVYTLTKASSSHVPNRTDTASCRIPGLQSGVVSCAEHVPSFDYRLDNGDTFTMKFEVTSGGNMRLSNGRRTTFNGRKGSKEIRMKFDFIPPYHCQEDHTCGSVRDKPFQVVNDITKNPVRLKWSGWGDRLSGLDSYVLEVFKLSGGGHILLEKDPMKPTFALPIARSGQQHTYTPNEPGMYSAILGVKDYANNTRYVRELFLYDATSDISKETSHPVHVTSASPESQYHWQTPNTEGKTAIEVDWTGHFVNKIHQDGGFLARVNDYPAQLKNKYLDTVQKAVSKELKNQAATRKSERIPNINSIVRFQLAVENFLVGTTPNPPTTENWHNTSLSENSTVQKSVSSGDCVLAWVRAYDIVGNNATDYGIVCFDDSPPVIRVISFERDLKKNNIQNSRFHLRTLDLDSGIAMVKWSFRDNVTHENIDIPAHDNVPIPGNNVSGTRESCEHSGECYCITTGECFANTVQLYVDQCVLYQSGMENTETHYIATITAYNQAMQNRSSEFLIENVQNLLGMDNCARILKERQSGALLAGGISATVICILVILAFVVFVVLYKTGRLPEKSRERIRSIRRSIRRGHGVDGLINYKTGGFDEDDIYMYGHQTYEHAPEWIVSPEDLTINNLIIVGKFAKIYEASLLQSGRQMKVVAKTLKSDYTEEDSVLMTAKINFFGTKVGRHSCILEMVGAILEDDKMGPVMILERCGYGSVKDWLGDNKDRHDESTIDFLFRFVYSIIQGMEYLASREITHMRLAARNVLLTDKLEPKIAGFGPRHGDDEGDGEQKERIPVKWIAPECMSRSKNAASEKSDVWSNAIVMWEIFSFGETPYPKIRSADLMRALKKGERLSKPEYCDETHYKIMTNSWNMKPAPRPTFREIREEIEQMFKGSGDDNYYDANFANR